MSTYLQLYYKQKPDPITGEIGEPINFLSMNCNHGIARHIHDNLNITWCSGNYTENEEYFNKTGKHLQKYTDIDSNDIKNVIDDIEESINNVSENITKAYKQYAFDKETIKKDSEGNEYNVFEDIQSSEEYLVELKCDKAQLEILMQIIEDAYSKYSHFDGVCAHYD